MVKKYVLVFCCVFFGTSLDACQGAWEGPTIKGGSNALNLIPHPEEWNVLVQGYVYPYYTPVQQPELAKEKSNYPSAEQICPFKSLTSSAE